MILSVEEVYSAAMAVLKTAVAATAAAEGNVKAEFSSTSSMEPPAPQAPRLI